jgi:hypothetical protein
MNIESLVRDITSPLEVGKFHNLQIVRKNRFFSVNLQVSTVPYFIQGKGSEDVILKSFVANHNSLTSALMALLKQLRT